MQERDLEVQAQGVSDRLSEEKARLKKERQARKEELRRQQAEAKAFAAGGIRSRA